MPLAESLVVSRTLSLLVVMKHESSCWHEESSLVCKSSFCAKSIKRTRNLKMGRGPVSEAMGLTSVLDGQLFPVCKPPVGQETLKAQNQWHYRIQTLVSLLNNKKDGERWWFSQKHTKQSTVPYPIMAARTRFSTKRDRNCFRDDGQHCRSEVKLYFMVSLASYSSSSPAFWKIQATTKHSALRWEFQNKQIR